MGNEELFKAFLEKYLAGDLRPGEEEQLMRMIQDPLYESSLEEFLGETYQEAGYAPPEWTEQFLEGLRARMDQEGLAAGPGGPAGIESNAGEKRGNKIFYMSRWAAAACILLLAGAYMLYRGHGSHPAVGGLHPSADIGPGNDMAVLTLADGRRIALDSSMADTISAAPGIPVINFKGKLAYNNGQAGMAAGAAAQYNTVSTARGNQYQLVLPDGTQVWLDASSSLHFPTRFGEGERRVELTGEGYFAVVHDAAHPFVVAFHHMEVKDLGTEFNIMAYPDEPATRVGLVKGSVSVSCGGTQAVMRDPGAVAVAENNPRDNKDLQIETGDPEQFAAWKNGQISFSNVDLPTLLREISRWYDVDVVYTGAIHSQRFGGMISRNIRLSAMLDILNKFGVNIRQEGRRLIVAPGNSPKQTHQRQTPGLSNIHQNHQRNAI